MNGAGFMMVEDGQSMWLLQSFFKDAEIKKEIV